jgi:hypothetical protein
VYSFVAEAFTIVLFDLFQELDVQLKETYLKALTKLRQKKLAEKCDCPVLTYTDVQDCIDIVNGRFQENESDRSKL